MISNKKTQIKLINNPYEEIGFIHVSVKLLYGDVKVCYKYKTKNSKNFYKIASIMHTSFESRRSRYRGLALEIIKETQPLKKGDILIEIDNYDSQEAVSKKKALRNLFPPRVMLGAIQL